MNDRPSEITNQTTQRRVSYDPRFFDNLLERQIVRERQAIVSGSLDTTKLSREFLRLNHSKWRSFLRRLSLRFLSGDKKTTDSYRRPDLGPLRPEPEAAVIASRRRPEI